MSEMNKNIHLKNEILKSKIKQLIPSSGLLETPIKGFNMSLRIKPNSWENCFYKPMVIIVIQGKKCTKVGSDQFIYKEKQCVVNSIDIPISGRIIEATEENPFMSLFLELDSYLIIQLLSEMNESKKNFSTQKAIGIVDVDLNLLDAFLRLTETLDKSEKERNILSPMIVKEIHYLLLSGPLNEYILSVNTKGTKSHQIAKAISWLKNNFKESVSMDDLADIVHMAPSSFYRNFNKITSITPLQYQKRLRLNEAQRLMLTGYDLASAAYDVGYKSYTQFNKEYKSMFGIPPKTDIKRLKMSVNI